MMKETNSQKTWRKLQNRLKRATQENGIGGVVKEIHNMLLFRIHDRVLDRKARRFEPDAISHTTELSSLTIDSENQLLGVEYTPTPVLVLSWIFQSLKINEPDWTFVDIGSGRGRVVIAASKRDFKKVIGVEFAEELHREAANNLSIQSRDALELDRVKLLHADATRFEIPDGPCVFYLFNPFQESVLEGFLNNAIQSYEAFPRPMIFAYSNPVHHKVFGREKRVRLRRKTLFEWGKFTLLSPHRFKLYELE